jgi:hypothetical protein
LTPVRRRLSQGSPPISLEYPLSRIAHEQFPTQDVKSHRQSPARPTVTYVKFAAKSTSSEITITYHNNAIISSLNVKILGIVIESSCTWKAHTAQLLPKLCKACFLMMAIKPIMYIETLKILYYTYFHSLMTYGIIFWGNSSFSTQIFRIQKRIKVMSGLRPRDSCREAFKDWVILLLQSQYIFSLLIFVLNNMGFYHSTSKINGFNKGHNFDLPPPPPAD